jgi:hypothetical protein
MEANMRTPMRLMSSANPTIGPKRLPRDHPQSPNACLSHAFRFFACFYVQVHHCYPGMKQFIKWLCIR